MTAPLKVVHLITGLDVGGAEMMLYKLLSRMDRKRFCNTVISLRDVGPVGWKIRELGLSVHELHMRPGQLPWHSVRCLVRLLREEQPLVLQTWMYHADLFGLIAGRRCRVPSVVWNVRCSDFVAHHHGTTTWVAKTCAALSRWPDAVAVNSEAGRAFHASLGYHPRRWIVLPNGFDVTRFAPDTLAREAVRADLQLPSDAVLIGLVARHDPMKDHETFLKAATQLAEQNAHVHFLLVGRDVNSSNGELMRIIARREGQERMHLLGERMDVPWIMAALDIATSSSAYGEGFSNSIGEAMACGVPCVVTNVGDSATVVGETGLVVSARDADALVRAWQRLIEAGPEARRNLGAAARERIRQNYSLDCVVRQYEDLYLSLGRA
jgi:glycosyltransferase involved in cell wall biosynthesis